MALEDHFRRQNSLQAGMLYLHKRGLQFCSRCFLCGKGIEDGWLNSCIVRLLVIFGISFSISSGSNGSLKQPLKISSAGRIPKEIRSWISYGGLFLVGRFGTIWRKRNLRCFEGKEAPIQIRKLYT